MIGLELRAYCGDRAAQAACVESDIPLPCTETDDCECDDLASWLAGLSRWPGALARAAVAAARVVVTSPAGERLLVQGEQSPGRVYTAIEAAEAWIADPSEERREACRRIYGQWHRPTTEERRADLWWVCPVYACTGLAKSEEEADSERREGIHEAARLTGEPTVRAAICAALIEWALK